MAPALNTLIGLFTAVLFVSLGISVPIIVVLAIRFLWYRDMNIGRSRELDKLIWQLHRIATALEQEKGLSFPAEQPGTERSADSVAAQRPSASPVAKAPSTSTLSTPTSGPDESPKAGVNSMFGF